MNQQTCTVHDTKNTNSFLLRIYWFEICGIMKPRPEIRGLRSEAVTLDIVKPMTESQNKNFKKYHNYLICFIKKSE